MRRGSGKEKQVAITSEKQAVLVEKPKPELREGRALVKIHAAPICTEYKVSLEGDPNDCLGHEAAGEVVETAPGSQLKRGDRVVVIWCCTLPIIHPLNGSWVKSTTWRAWISLLPHPMPPLQGFALKTVFVHW